MAQYKSIKQVLNDFGKDTVEKLKQSIDRSDAVASGVLRESLDFEVTETQSGFEFKLDFTKGEGYKYAKAVDKGRRPGKQPPLEPIMRWIANKGIALPPVSTRRQKLTKSLKNKTVRKTLKQLSTQQRARSLAYLIARKIGEKGTPATSFYSSVVTPSLFEQLKKDLAKAAVSDILFDLKTT